MSKPNVEMTLPEIFLAAHALAKDKMTAATLGETSVIITHEMRGISPEVQACILAFTLMALLEIPAEALEVT